MIVADTAHLRWSTERFYWGVIDAAALGRRSSHDQLCSLFESLLPRPVDDVLVIFVRLNDSRRLGCGVDREAVLSALNAGAVTLQPSAIPPWLEVAGEINLERLNLLVGEATPTEVRRARRRWIIRMGAVMAMAMLVAQIGFDIRRRSILSDLDRARNDMEAIYEQTVGGLARPGGQPASMVFLGELRRLRRTRSPEHRSDVTFVDDAAIGLSAALSHWPDKLPFQCETLAVTADVISIHGRAPTNEDAQSVIHALDQVDGWLTRQPQVRSDRNDVRLTLRLERAATDGVRP